MPVGVQLVERARRDPGGHQRQHHPGEHVGHVELSGVGGVGHDHVAAEHRHRQAAQVVGLAQQHLAGPLAVAVAVGVVVADLAGRAHLPDVGILDERARLDAVTDADRRDVDERLDPGGQGDADQFRGADDVGPEQLAVGQHVVDQGGGVDDQVDGVGQSLPSGMLQAEIRFALVAGEHLEVIGGQRPVVLEQFRIAAVERRVETLPRSGVVLGADQERSPCRRPDPSARATAARGSGRGTRSPR